jgi:hypothetical protein
LLLARFPRFDGQIGFVFGFAVGGGGGIMVSRLHGAAVSGFGFAESVGHDDSIEEFPDSVFSVHFLDFGCGIHLTLVFLADVGAEFKVGVGLAIDLGLFVLDVVVDLQV